MRILSKKKVKKSSDRKADRSSSKPNTKQTTQPQTTDESKDTMELTRYQRWRARAVDLINERLQNESKKMIALKFFAAPIVVLLGILFLNFFH